MMRNPAEPSPEQVSVYSGTGDVDSLGILMQTFLVGLDNTACRWNSCYKGPKCRLCSPPNLVFVIPLWSIWGVDAISPHGA